MSQQLAKVATSFKHVRNPCDIAATNRTKNRTWFTRAILKLQLWRGKNCIELPRQKSPVETGLYKSFRIWNRSRDESTNSILFFFKGKHDMTFLSKTFCDETRRIKHILYLTLILPAVIVAPRELKSGQPLAILLMAFSVAR